MQRHTAADRVALLPESDEEAHALLDAAEAINQTDRLMAWRTCDGAEYDGLDANIEDGVLVISARSSTSRTSPMLSSLLAVAKDALLGLLLAIGVFAVVDELGW